jgi:hypothetical protein
MDCLNLYKRTKSIGNYWANAVHFTICNISQGVSALKVLDWKLEGKATPEELSRSDSSQLNTLTIKTVSKPKFSSLNLNSHLINIFLYLAGERGGMRISRGISTGAMGASAAAL